MNETAIFIVAAIVVVLLLLFFLLRGRKQRVTFGEAPTSTRTITRPPAPAPAPPPAPGPAPVPVEEGHGLGSEVTAAIEDVVDQFVGIDAHASGQASAITSGDPLTLLKGLGPKAAACLNDLGVTRFEQIAAWDETDVAAIDARMGVFKGRIARDRWVEQAALLAKGDRAGFEERFGNLGG